MSLEISSHFSPLPIRIPTVRFRLKSPEIPPIIQLKKWGGGGGGTKKKGEKRKEKKKKKGKKKRIKNERTKEKRKAKRKGKRKDHQKRMSSDIDIVAEKENTYRGQAT
jgi:hypothetical protein